MSTLTVRKLFLVLPVFAGLTWVGFAALLASAQVGESDVPEIDRVQGIYTSLAARVVPTQTLTHPYTPTLNFVGAVGGTGGDLASGNGYAYVGDGTQLSVFNVSDPAAPRRVARLSQRGAIHQIQLIEDRLFVAANFGGLRIYNMSVPEHPRLLSVFADGNTISSFNVAGHLVYAIEGMVFEVIDISDPTLPLRRGDIEINYASYYDIIRVGNTVFVGTNTIDASNPDQLEISATITGTWNAVGGEIAVADTVGCFKGSCWGGMVFYDISNPLAPVRSGEYQTNDIFGKAVIDGDIVYYSHYGQIGVLDTSQPLAPVLLSTYPGSTFEKDGDLLYVGQWTWDDINRMYLFNLNLVDFSDLENPELVGSSPALSDIVYDYSRSGDLVFLRLNTNNWLYLGLQLIDVKNHSNPRLAGVSYEKHLLSISETLVEGNHAYVLANLFQILDFRNAAAPGFLGSHTVSSVGLAGLNVVGDIAYMIGAEQVKVVDIHDPTLPSIIQVYGGDSDDDHSVQLAQILENHQGYLVVDDWMNFRSNLRIMQFNPPAQPTIRSTFEISPSHYIRALDGTLESVFISLDNGDVELLDTRDPYKPTVKGLYSSTQVVTTMRQTGDLVLLGGDGKLAIVDFSIPISPTLVGELAIPAELYDIQVDGGWAYVAVGSAWNIDPGMWVVDISDPSNPTLFDIYPTTAYNIQIKGGLAYISAFGDGLHVVNLFEPSIYLPQLLISGL